MLEIQKSQRERVAIGGDGPSGLAVAKYLKQHGFDPVVFEQSVRWCGRGRCVTAAPMSINCR